MENVTTSTSFDWRERGAVNRVRDQGDCGSCWAFASVGVLESHHFIKTGKLLNFSEQQLIDCSSSNRGCGGGRTEETFNYFIDNDIAMAESYPYEGKEEKCRLRKAEKSDVKIYGYGRIQSGKNALLKAVNQLGPIYVGVDANHKTFRFYSEGIFSYSDCDDFEANHVAIIVGFGRDNKTGLDYWILRNSWSENWGESGYMRMARNTSKSCNIANEAFLPLLTDNGENLVDELPNIKEFAAGNIKLLLVIFVVILVVSGCQCFCIIYLCCRRRQDNMMWAD